MNDIDKDGNPTLFCPVTFLIFSVSVLKPYLSSYHLSVFDPYSSTVLFLPFYIPTGGRKWNGRSWKRNQGHVTYLYINTLLTTDGYNVLVDFLFCFVFLPKDGIHLHGKPILCITNANFNIFLFRPGFSTVKKNTFYTRSKKTSFADSGTFECQMTLWNIL